MRGDDEAEKRNRSGWGIVKIALWLFLRAAAIVAGLCRGGCGVADFPTVVRNAVAGDLLGHTS